MNDYQRRGSRIVVDDGTTRRALFKVQPLPDGGYAVLAPYHAAREGWLARVHVDYSKAGETKMSFRDLEHFTADDRVKLSHHVDGFVQFSGENPGKIVSGRDPATGEPKGLAVQSARIGLPITTGPTFGGTVWGLDQFRDLTSLRNSDLYFTPSEIYYRSPPDVWNAYLLEGWVFWPPMWAGVSGSEYDLRISIGFRNFEGSGSNLHFRVIPLVGNNCFLGISIHRIKVSFPSASGFSISGPSDRRQDATEANALMAVYPRDDVLNAQNPVSLDYQPPVQPPSDPAMLNINKGDGGDTESDR